MSRFDFSKHLCGNGKAFVIAEVAQAHDGSLGTAHAYIDAVADCGVDGVKFQTHIASEESTLDEPFRVSFGVQDETRYDYWQRMEFSEEQWQGLYDHASEKGLVFLSSPFSVAAVEMLHRIGVSVWKVASGEILTPDIFSAIARTKLPIIVSSGMSSPADIDIAVSRLQENSLEYALMQCTSMYPTPLEMVGLNILDEFKSKYGCPVGLSDHSGSIYPALMAMARSANLIEVHSTLSKQAFGPDVSSSLVMDDLKRVCEARDAFAMMVNNPVDKEKVAKGLAENMKLFSKSVVLKSAQSNGTVLSKDMLTLKKPGTGISASEQNSLIGRKLKRDVSSDRLLRWEDLES